MAQGEKTLTEEEVQEARERRLVAMHLQDMASNPLSADQVAMFEMFEREAWPHSRRLAYVKERAEAVSKASVAESALLSQHP